VLRLNKFQLKEISKFWFDLAKLTLISLVLKLFEPGAPSIDLRSTLTVISGLIIASAFIIIGLLFSRGVKE